MNKLLVFTLTFIISVNAYSFDLKKKISLNRRQKYPVGLNLVGFGTSRYVGGSVDWFFTPKLNIEGGFGVEDYVDFKSNAFLGLKYHVFGKTFINITPFVGAFVLTTPFNQFNQQYLYVPIGIQKIKKNKLTWSAEIAYRINLNAHESNLWGGFKIGYRFNRIKK